MYIYPSPTQPFTQSFRPLTACSAAGCAEATKHSMDLVDLTGAQKADIEHLAATCLAFGGLGQKIWSWDIYLYRLKIINGI